MVAAVHGALRKANLPHFKTLEELKSRLKDAPKSKKIRKEGLKALGIVARAVRTHLSERPDFRFDNLHEDFDRYSRTHGHIPQLRILGRGPGFASDTHCVSYARGIHLLLEELVGGDIEHGVISVPQHVAKTINWGNETLVMDPHMDHALAVDDYLAEILKGVHDTESVGHAIALGSGLVGHTNPQAYLHENVGLHDNEALTASEFGNHGVHLLRVNRIHDAIRWMRRSLQHRDNHVATLANLAWTYMEKGNLKLAEKYFGKALQKSPHFLNAHVGMGRVQIRRGRIDLALESAARAAALRPYDGLVHHLFAKIHQAQGKHEKALHLFRKSAMANIREYWAHYDLGMQYLKMGKKEAIGELRHCVALNPYFPDGHYQLARALARWKTDADAIPLLQRAIRLAPKSKRPRQMLKAIRAKMNQ